MALGVEPAQGMNAVEALEEAVYEIRSLRSSIKSCRSVVDVEVALKKAEDGLILRAKENMASGICGSLSCSGAGRTRFRRAARIVRQQPFTEKASAGGALGAGVSRVEGRYILNPASKEAREYLKERFGVNFSSTDTPKMASHSTGNIRKYDYTGVSNILPREVREDPWEFPCHEQCAVEMPKGMLHLVNRRFFPSWVDISAALLGSSWVFRSMPSMIHPFHIQFLRPPPTNALEDSLLARNHMFKLDVLIPTENKGCLRAVVGRESARCSSAVDEGVNGAGEDKGASARNSPKDREARGEVREGGQEVRFQEPQDPREYDKMMDDHSLHEVLIRNGTVVDTTPEFMSFHRSHSATWPVVTELLLRLEGICAQYAVPLAVVDGRALADMVGRGVDMEGGEWPVEEVLACVKNIQEVAAVLKEPGRRFKGIKGQDHAASVIQAHFRGFRLRVRYPRIDKLRLAATQLQRIWRMNHFRQAIFAKVKRVRLLRDLEFKAIQSKLAEDWDAIHSQHHVVIHVPSLSGNVPPATRFAHQDVLEMSRLCDVADPLVEVIYVVPVPVEHEVSSYWKKLLNVGGVEEPEGKYRTVYPENSDRLPAQMSLTSRLLSSPRAMDRIKVATKGRPAYIVPGLVGDEEVGLVVALGIPLLGPPPSASGALALKSGARAAFRSARMNIPPGCDFQPIPDTEDAGVPPLSQGTSFEIGGSGEMLLSENDPPGAGTGTQRRRPRNDGFLIKKVAETIVRHPNVSKWVLKVDNELGSSGVAVFSVADMKGAKDALDRYAEFSTDDRGGTFKDDAVQVAAFKVTGALTKHLPHKLKILQRDAYGTYREFVQAIRTSGGVLEASPDSISGWPSMNIFINPDGNARVISTHEQVFCPPHCQVGYSFPQSSVPNLALVEAASAIATVVHRLGVVGHMEVDFMAVRESGCLRMWATGLRPYYSASLTTFQLFDFLTAGEFDAAVGAYTVPDEGDGGATEAEGASSSRSTPGHRAFQRLGDNGLGATPRGGATPYSDLQSSASSPRSVPVGEGPGAMTPGEDRAREPAHARAGVANQQRRFYVALTGLRQEALKSLRCAAFFHSCRIHGFCFDMQGRIGTVFNVNDRFSSGSLGVLCAGFSPSDAFTELSDVMDFMASEYGDLRLTAKSATAVSAAPCHAGGVDFNMMRAAVRYLTERLKDRH